MALEHLLLGLLEFATNEQDSQNALTTLREGRKEMIDRVVQRMCEPAKGYAVFPSFLLFSGLTLPLVLVAR
jgi:hypothetical protein